MPEFSYSTASDPPLRRLTIKAIERMTGQPRIERIYAAYRRHRVPGESVWRAAMRWFELDVRFDQEQLDRVPRTGPLVIVANHPFGVLDGMVVSYLVGRVRPVFRVLAHSLLDRTDDARDYLLPIDFSETDQALKTNLETRRRALSMLADGHCVVVFPAGRVATARTPFGRAWDDEWKPFTAKLILASGAPVVPLYFEGQNGPLFQAASHVNETLRYSLLFNELANKIGCEVPVRIGDVVAPETLAGLGSREAVMTYLRDTTYGLLGDAPHRFRLRKVPRAERRRRVLQAAPLG